MTSLYNFKKIEPVPTASDFIDIILSKTQRKTPTVIHKNYNIGRIRQFYMRKVKFTQENFEEKFKHILEEFPKLEDIHPFYADLMNVLYDKDHYKLALGQINTARHLIDQVAKDYVRLLKFGDSLYRCKQLKKAALGRMATVMKRQKDSLAYLEQVRQHLSRLPSIDPNTRTLLICGYPNVGKSSFINKITRADVDVQPYAFTTKSLFVGHMDYKYMRWQVIDTPGILDHPLEERNTIEMQSITAMAHLRSCIMYFMDLSEQCGYSVEDQVKLFHNIKPLFANKPIVLVINKIDQMKPEDLPEEQRKWIEDIANEENATVLTMSCYNEEGVMNVRNISCDKLLAARVEMKMKSNKMNDVINKIHLAIPQQRDNVARLPNIPAEVTSRAKYDPNDPNRRQLEKDLEVENGGAGVYNVDLKKKYLLKEDDWKYDVIPEFLDGHNVADFIDPEIEEKLEALEREEERLEQEGFYQSDDDMLDDDEEAYKAAADAIREKKKLIVQAHRAAHGRNRPVLPKPTAAKFSTVSEMNEKLAQMGIDSADATERVREAAAHRKRTREEALPDEAVKEATADERAESENLALSQQGFRNVKQKMEADKQKKNSQKQNNKMGKRGESDRSIQTKMPKHLFSGKLSAGTRDRR
ncbi:GTP binding protein 4 [Rhizopus microsporus var. microsporus]|uniref:Nucleolar GTP-binding protein 1 n=2 Tax=Rhizopus microsporus TaxID=58291 RepID=A0A2G4SPZ8_RHIZD|nr:putative NOG1-nucleolar G-protein required for 60S ribosomal subunit biogenesis [Rhizopus microsporus ATCC 52813]ORE01583.1 GTP binding protein 4 [Rhizopus microsporus var. microsporus]PHZ10825.1 putative NOG1-nucleolar G-protein required for 60S ribosomal subunit biogenesis [Rhizopus microsporus ATCC 52813]